MIDQTITTPPPAPSSNDIPTFKARFDAFLAWMVVFVSQLVTLVSQINSTATTVNNDATTASNAKDAAVASANFQGTWTNQTTQVGQSWEFEGIVYRVLIAGNTSPTSSPLNWTSIAATSDALMDEINLKADKATTYTKTEVESLVGDGLTLAQAHATALSF